MADPAVAGSDPASNGQAPPSAAPPEPGTAPPAPHPAYRPEGLPDTFYGSSDRETIDKMWPALKGFRQAQSERGNVPDKFDAYNFNLSDKAKPYVAVDKDDKLIPQVKQIAQKWGMPDKMFSGFVGDFFDRIVDLDLIEKPVDPKQFYKELGAAEGGTDEYQITKGAARAKQSQHFIDIFSQQLGLDPDEKNEMMLFSASAPGVRVTEKIMKSTIGRNFSPGGSSSGSDTSKEEIAQRRDDPRNDRNSPKYDPNFAAETIERYKRLYET